jgi:hypothetical protein
MNPSCPWTVIPPPSSHTSTGIRPPHGVTSPHALVSWVQNGNVHGMDGWPAGNPEQRRNEDVEAFVQLTTWTNVVSYALTLPLLVLLFWWLLLLQS